MYLGRVAALFVIPENSLQLSCFLSALIGPPLALLLNQCKNR
ncbi:hypothetical protein MNBD_ALPHA11-958 [hydrothermal vent metagenome]|uniref:Uncharacterized protein n=1 Tax=hydrothermal vent metagenome TaxID=652676 RepID=A0A3B0UFE0_9ZZZZ